MNAVPQRRDGIELLSDHELATLTDDDLAALEGEREDSREERISIQSADVPELDDVGMQALAESKASAKRAMLERFEAYQAVCKGDPKPMLAVLAKMLPPSPRISLDVNAVIDRWAEDGPLVHVPTGIARLDELTGGGPVFGTRWYLLGAPDACKTLLQSQIADEYVRLGLAVGMVAVDEEPSDLLIRWLQRRGFSRAECERRDPLVLSRMRDAMDGLHVRFYDSEWTIERAASDFDAFARSVGKRAALFIDSTQTVECDTEAEAKSLREQVTARARAIRAAASNYRMIVCATSEMSRGAYRSVEASEASDDMAAAKESGAIEYSARVMLSLRSVKDDSDLIEMRIVKNKHGPRDEQIWLKLDRRLQQLTEVDAAEAPVQLDRAESREAARVSREQGKNLKAAAALVLELAKVVGAGMSTRDVEPALRAAMGSCSRPLAEAAIHVLGDGLSVVYGPRNARRLHLNGPGVHDDVLALLDASDRARVATTTPPTPVEVAS